MEDSGGVSVSDLVAKHGGSRSDLKPVNPPPHAAALEQPSGSHRLTQPQPPATGGGHRRALPDEPPSQPRMPAPQPTRAAAPAYGMQPQGTGRTRSGNDIAAGQAAGHAQNDARHSQRMPRPVPGAARAAAPTQRPATEPRVGTPRQTNGMPGGARRAAQQAQQAQAQPAQQSQPALSQPSMSQPLRTQPPQARPAQPSQQLPTAPAQPGQTSGNRAPVGPSAWEGQPARTERPRATPASPLPAPGPLGGAGVAVPARGQRTNGRPNGSAAARMPRGRTATPPAPRSNPMPTTPAAATPPLPAPAPPGAGSRPGMLPVGRQTATALAVPVRKPAQAPPPMTAPPQPPPMATPQQPPPDEAETAIRPVDPEERALLDRPDRPDGPERREDIDPTCMTTEMEPISEVVQQKRKVDATLARFSAVHDEMADEERQRRSRRVKLMPWLGRDDDLEEALSGVPLDNAEPETPVEVAAPDVPAGVTRIEEKLRRKHGRTRLSGRIAGAGVAALVLVGCFFGWRAVTHVTSNQIQEVAALDENSPAILESPKQYGDSNFLLVGTTSRPGATATGDQSTNTMMVAHIPADGSRAVIVSFPPNLQANRPVCQQWNNQTNKVGAQVAAKTGVKLNSIYATGGPRCLTDTVQQLTGLRINHFVGIDLNGFRDLANSVGGVDMCVKAPLNDAALGTIVNRAGPVSLSGDQALNFVRADQIINEQGVADFTRINRQQRFLAALLRKTIGQQNLLMNANMLNNVLGTFTTSTFGDNMGVSGLSKLATSLQGLALGRITFVTLPTTGALNQAGDETQNADSSKQLFNAIIDNAPLPGEATGTTNTSANAPAVTPQTTKIQVLNATNEGSAASQTATALGQQGFQITSIGPATVNVTTTVIKYSAPQLAQAQLLGSAVPSATLQADPTMDGAIQLIIGPGFDHKVQTAHAGGGTNTANAGSSEAPAQLSYVNAADTACA